ncbi:MAG: DUF4494 domain-containing protein [Ruminococcus sp.]|nr:DUF4494 domain-containing protein [Ruminococcus sp.]MCM1438992.1 DUF4494 domain-containing protein [Roseburia sp.]
MANYIETRIRYDKMNDNGVIKKTTEAFLVDALSFTEAEARIIEEMTPFISGDFTVSAVKKSNIAELFRDESGDRWYKCKIEFITIDECTAAEKRSASYILVQAVDFRNAYENLLAGMKGTISDFDIAAITETKILDVYGAKLDTEKAAD